MATYGINPCGIFCEFTILEVKFRMFASVNIKFLAVCFSFLKNHESDLQLLLLKMDLNPIKGLTHTAVAIDYDKLHCLNA